MPAATASVAWEKAPPAETPVFLVREPGNTCTGSSPPKSTGKSRGSITSRSRFFQEDTEEKISIFRCVRSSRKGLMIAHDTEKMVGTLMMNMRPSVSG